MEEKIKFNPATARLTLKIYWKFVLQYKITALLPFVLIILTVIIQDIAWPFVLSRIFDNFTLVSTKGAESARSAIVPDFKLIVLMALWVLVVWRPITFAFIRNQARVLRDLEQFVFKKLQKHSYNFFSDNFAGALVTQTKRFVGSFESLEDQLFFEYIPLLVRVIFSITVLMFVAPAIGWPMLIWTILFSVSVIVIARYKSKITKVAARADSRVTAELADAITNAINIKIFARADSEQQRFDDVSQNRYKKRLRSWDWDEYIRAYQTFMMLALELTVLWISINLVLNQTITLGIVLLTQLYLGRIFTDLWNLGRYIQRSERSISEAAEMTEILNREVEVDDVKQNEKPKITDGAIKFHDVSFSYAKAKEKLFEGLNIEVHSGQKVGLVGPSGGGKTTLTKLLLRFADIQSGTITIDGQDISKLAQKDLREHIAYVPQEPILFHRTIAENIRYGYPGASDTEIKKAARLAHASEFIEKLPHGYDTLVGERGMKLSGGQKQRVAIARAMLVKAPVLLLDEATSALDSKSEKLIADALDNLMNNRTTIVIAHRLSTIRKLDKIIVMKEGKIFEEGRHDELLQNKNGVYAELWNHQSGDFLED